jgi:hypothetical protein
MTKEDLNLYLPPHYDDAILSCGGPYYQNRADLFREPPIEDAAEL